MTAAEIAALIDSTEVSLYQPEMIGREVRGGDETHQNLKKGRKGQDTHHSRWTGNAAYE
jgi:hypothetical protein